MIRADPLDDAVEGRRADHLAEREFEVEGGEIVLERDQLLAARRLVDAVHHRRLLALQRLGRRDIGGDHDNPRPAGGRRAARAARPTGCGPSRRASPAVREGRARAARACCAPRAARASRPTAASAPCRPTSGRPSARLGHRAGRRSTSKRFLARFVHRGLSILIGNVCCYANLGARKSPAFRRPVLADMEVAGHRRAGLALLQRADVRRQLVRQHRHDPVGEIDAVAARAGPRGRARCRAGRSS